MDFDFKGWFFIDVTPRGVVKRMGMVVDKVVEGTFLCHVFNEEQSCGELVKAEDMLLWKLFPDQQARDGFLNAQKKVFEENRARAEASKLAQSKKKPGKKTPGKKNRS